jgi:Apoptosis inhibitory protein 5 (API5)
MQHQEDRFLREAYKNRDKDTVSYPKASNFLLTSASSFQQQRRALVRLLELSHSENAESKKFAAAQFKHYITLFPDLEDAVINAIYDLCEDQVSLVRVIQRYFGHVCANTTAVVLFWNEGTDSGIPGYSGSL